MDPLLKYLKFNPIRKQCIKCYQNIWRYFRTIILHIAYFLSMESTVQKSFTFLLSFQKPMSDVFRYLELGNGRVGLWP